MTDAAARIAVAGFSLVVAAGFARVFPGWSFLPDLALIVLVGHGLSTVLARLRVTGWLAVPAVTFAVGWVVARLSYGSTFSWGLPTSQTWQLARLELDVVRQQFATTTAPVEYGAGWALLAAVGVGIVVLLGDTFAFRAEARAETLVPGGVLFVIVGALGDERLRIATTVAVVAAGYVTVVALRALHTGDRRPVLRASRAPVDLVAPTAICAALVVALVAGAVGPRLPGAGEDPLIDTRGRSGGVTEVVSPLVDIRSRLVNQSDTELFRVSSDTESYWRLTTLPEFDGTTFRLPTRSLQRIEGAFGNVGADDGVIRQDIEIVALGGQLVPAAAEPVQAAGDGLRWNPDTATLVNVDGDLARGDRFTVVSASPRPETSLLRATTTAAPPDPVHLELPEDFPASVSDLAATLTDTAPTAYDAAIALQTFFRTEFQYSLDVPAGHGASAIEVFLRQRIGYCEQFAATFAAMARSIGLPSRVAVGYTSGLRTPDGRYSVLGRNAHAWPEIWFDGVGWVPFEPTPGRGAPGTEQFTGVAPAQDETPAGTDPTDDDATTGDADDDGLAADGATPPSVPDVSPEPLVPDDGGATPPDAGDDATRGGATSERSTPWWQVLGSFGLLALVLGPAFGRRAVERRRRHRPAGEQVGDAWRSAVRAVTDAGVAVRPSMTRSQVAAATADVLPVAARPMRALAETMDSVVFGPPGTVDLERTGPYGETVTRNCQVWAHQIDGITADRLPMRTRLGRYVAFWR